MCFTYRNDYNFGVLNLFLNDGVYLIIWTHRWQDETIQFIFLKKQTLQNHLFCSHIQEAKHTGEK